MSGKLTIDEIREKLAGRTGEQYWRSLDELADTEEFRAAMQNEFPAGAPVWEDPVSRRRFLHLMGASIALAGLSSCVKQPDEKILPYVKQPEYLIPGKPLTFASAFTMNGFATGILVTSHMGRPTKIQGNPDHPASLGAADTFSMASILHLYDPDRSQVVRQKGEITTLNKFLVELSGALDAQKALGGRGLRVLTGTVTSPTLAWQIESLLKEYPLAGWHRYDPATGLGSEREGSRLAFGEYAQAVYHFDRADVVVSLDSDFIAEGPAHLKYAREFSARRRVRGAKADINRLYVAESFPTVTGSVADHRMPVRASHVAELAGALASRLGLTRMSHAELPPDEAAWIGVVAADLTAHRGACVVVAGANQPAAVHALVHAINQALGNHGATVSFVQPAEYGLNSPGSSLGALMEEMHRGDVDLLLVGGCNPVYDAPADFDFANALDKTGMSVSLNLYNDETARACGWHVPESHYLEAWSDARAFDGTASIVQPLIAPLYNTMSVHELLAEMTGKSGKKGYEIVREYWKDHGRRDAVRKSAPREQAGDDHDFETFWRTGLNEGVVPGTASPAMSVKFRGAEAFTAIRKSAEALKPPPPSRISFPGSDVEVMFRPDPTIGDGRFSNNGWLQELPKPITKLTWDNAAFVSPSLAEDLGVYDEDLVEIRIGGGKCRLPLLVLPGHPHDSVTLHLGYGRAHAGRIGDGAGVNVYPLRFSGSSAWGRGSIAWVDEIRALARTQDHHSMEGRPIVRRATVTEFESEPRFAKEMAHVPTKDQSLYQEHEYDGYKWGMSIDLNSCTGCNACVIACQSENNIPIAGKDQVLNGREMHWIRIDRYYSGDMDNPEILSQPVACMHCENAPCEPVCPVAATNHDSEGLNVMVYNRCVGTRYCSNNCPYKVRRFNFLQYSDVETPSIQMMYNPDVTVRNRGVMEKCTYCVQRISAARIDAKKEDRPIREGDVVTACQSACPAQAIVFGDLNDPESAVSKAKAQPRDYGLLAELNTHPRTSYLARLTNPNPALDAGKGRKG